MRMIGAKGLLAFNLLVIGLAVVCHWISGRGNPRNSLHLKYDYIIVGAGTAGCVLARRLLDEKNYGREAVSPAVLLVEAGEGEAPWYASVPLASLALQGTSIDWQYFTEPHEDALHCYRNKTMRWPRGKALGGSSNLYCLIHSRPTARDWQVWSQHCYTCGFSSTQAEDFFRKFEYRVRAGDDGRNPPNGQVPVSSNSCDKSRLCSAFREAAEQLKFSTQSNRDENLIVQNNIYRGQRWTSYDTYVKSVLQHPRLTLWTGAHATRVDFEGTTAVGIEVVTSKNETYLVSAKQNVILSAGAIGSPHILLLSGVGPKEELDRLSIPVVSDVPGVGNNLQDQIAVPMYFSMEAPLSINEDKVKTLRQIWSYIWGQGLLTQSGVEGILRTQLSDRDSEVMFMLLNIGSIREDVFAKISNQHVEDLRASFPGSWNSSKEGFLMLVSCLHPKSRGRLTLRSRRATDHPRMDPRYFSHRHDVKCSVEAMKAAFRLASTAPMAALGLTPHLPPLRHCAGLKRSTDDEAYLECWARAAVTTLGHLIGTAAMGDPSDPDTVVDAQFKVRGTRNLRVVDASVIPSQPSSTPHATVLWFAEKAAQEIMSCS